MTSSLVDSMRGAFTGGTAERAASALGIAPEAAAKGLSGAGSTMLAGLASKAHDPIALSEVVELMQDPSLESASMNDASRLLGDDKEASHARSSGNKMMSTLFGGRTDELTTGLSRHAGIGKGAAASLLGLAAPLVLRKLGSIYRNDGLNTAGFGRMLAGQQREIMAAVPGSMQGMFGDRDRVVERVGDRVVTDTREVRHTHDGSRRRDPGSKSAWWILPLALIPLLLIGMLLSRGRRNEEKIPMAGQDLPAATIRSPKAPAIPNAPTPSAPSVTTPTTPTPPTTTTPRAPAATAPATPEMRSERLSQTGAELHFAPNGVESKLLGFLRDPNAKPDDKVWFEFDRLTFDTDKATLEPGSSEQLDNLAAIMTAYPKAKIKIGGYTDNTGSPKANKKLSQERADSVKKELVERGIAPDRLTTEGYGEHKATASNKTEEGRAQNRRTAVRVTTK